MADLINPLSNLCGIERALLGCTVPTQLRDHQWIDPLIVKLSVQVPNLGDFRRAIDVTYHASSPRNEGLHLAGFA